MEIQPRVQSRRINEVYFGKLIIFHFIPNHIIWISGNSKLVHLWGSSGQMFPWGDGELLRKTIMSRLSTQHSRCNLSILKNEKMRSSHRLPFSSSSSSPSSPQDLKVIIPFNLYLYEMQCLKSVITSKYVYIYCHCHI